MLAILSIVIGLVFVLLLFSMLTSALVEVYHAYRGSRGNHLKATLEMMLGPEKAHQFLDHPYFKQLSAATKPTSEKKLPVWIDKNTFSTILADILTPRDGMSIQDRINSIENEELRKVMNFLWRQSGGDVQLFQAKVERWFDEVMDRAKEWFADSTKWRLFFFGTVLAIALNADTIQIYQSLSANANLRDEVVNAAEKFVNSPDTVLVRSGHLTKPDTVVIDTTRAKQNFTKIKSMYDETIASPLGLGWGADQPASAWDWLAKAIGWLLTGVAITMGAPFWFEMLKKLLSLKGEKSNPDSSSSERSTAPPPPQQQPAFEIKSSRESAQPAQEEAAG